jgi:hypothetical protein
MFEVQ